MRTPYGRLRHGSHALETGTTRSELDATLSACRRFSGSENEYTGARAGPRPRGPPPTGPPTTFSVRFPDELLAVLDAEVKTRGIDRNDVIVEKLARLYGVPVLSPPRQETLPLTEAA